MQGQNLDAALELLAAQLSLQNGQQRGLVGLQEMVADARSKWPLLHRDLCVAGPHNEVPRRVDEDALAWPLVQDPHLSPLGHQILQAHASGGGCFIWQLCINLCSARPRNINDK